MTPHHTTIDRTHQPSPIIALADYYGEELCQAVNRLLDASQNPLVIAINSEHAALWESRCPGVNIQIIPNDYYPNENIYWEKLTKYFSENTQLYALTFAGELLKSGMIDGVVGGKSYPTADILRVLIKTAQVEGEKEWLISSHFFMQKGSDIIIFADCAVIPFPTIIQKQKILDQTLSQTLLYNIEAKVYMSPEMITDGLIVLPSFQAANIEQANIFLFPDLNAGNIAYKIFQAAWYQAIGPILQGFQNPSNDLSRWASDSDILQVYHITKAQIQQQNKTPLSLHIPDHSQPIDLKISLLQNTQQNKSSYFTLRLWEKIIECYASNNNNYDALVQDIYNKNPPANIALLSYISGANRSHNNSDHIQAILDTKKKFSSYSIDGPIQFDAAYNETIRHQKLPKSSLTSDARIYIFPDTLSFLFIYNLLKRIETKK